MIICPNCSATSIDLDEYEIEVGDIVSCPDCGTDFSIEGKNPIDLIEIEDEEEYDEDDEEDSDEIEDD